MSKDDNFLAQVTEALSAARDRLLAQQCENGSWNSDIYGSAWSTATYVVALHQLGRGDDPSVDRAVHWLLDHQHPDGSWQLADDRANPRADLETSAQALLALRLAGHGDHPAARRAGEHLDRLGGVGRCDLMTKLFHALAGQWFANQVFPFPVSAQVLLMPDTAGTVSLPAWLEVLFPAVVTLLSIRGPRQRTLAQEIAWQKAEATILSYQNSDGGWYATLVHTAVNACALRELGYPPDHPRLRQSVAWLRGLTNDDGSVRGFVAPVRATALATLALSESGLPGDHPALTRAGRYLLDTQRCANGAAWAFEPANLRYPDADDTALCVTALTRVALPPDRRTAGVQRAAGWLQRGQNGDGGWSMFTRDQALKTCGVPPADNEDPSTADVVGHVLLGLAAAGEHVGRLPIDRAVRWVRTDQDRGAWFGRWGVCYTYGTSAVLVGLRAVGENMTARYVRQAVGWLEEHQNADGGWGEDYRSYYYPWRAGQGGSTVEQTAWALIGLLAAGQPVHGPAVARGVGYLLSRRTPDGGWPSSCVDVALWLHQDGLSSMVWPLLALGMYRTACERVGTENRAGAGRVHRP